MSDQGFDRIEMGSIARMFDKNNQYKKLLCKMSKEEIIDELLKVLTRNRTRKVNNLISQDIKAIKLVIKYLEL